MAASTLLLIILTGLAAGLLSGLMGVGGGTITIPALVLIVGMSQHLAQGISLAIIIPTAMIGAYGYYLKGHVDVELGIKMAAGAVLGTFIGSLLACRIASGDLKKIFGVFVIMIAIKVAADVFSGKK